MLASRLLADIDADVVAIGRMLRVACFMRLIEQCENRRLLLGRHVEKICDMPFRYSQDMSTAKGIVVVAHIRQRVLKHHFARQHNSQGNVSLVMADRSMLLNVKIEWRAAFGSSARMQVWATLSTLPLGFQSSIGT